MAAKTKVKAGAEAVSETAVLNAPPTMRPEIVTFRVVGVSPLLQNNPAEFIGKTEEPGELIAGKKQYNDDDEAAARCYRDEHGNFCHPSEAFLKSMVRAVTGKKFGKVSAPSVIRGAVFVVESLSIIEDENGKPATTYKIDRRSVVIGKSRILRCRPVWSPWRMQVSLEIDTAIVAPESVLSAMQLAGRIIGVGDYRPEKGGGFGRFTAEIA